MAAVGEDWGGQSYSALLHDPREKATPRNNKILNMLAIDKARLADSVSPILLTPRIGIAFRRDQPAKFLPLYCVTTRMSSAKSGGAAVGIGHRESSSAGARLIVNAGTGASLSAEFGAVTG